MKSRMDRERAIYVNKLTQIKQNLIADMPQLSKPDPYISSPHAPSIADIARNALLFDGLTSNMRQDGSKPSSSNLTDMIAGKAVRQIDQELNDYHRHMVIYEREGIDEDDEDDEEDAETSKKEKQSSQSCSLRSNPGQV